MTHPKKFKVTPMQRHLMIRMKGGDLRRDQISNALNSLHILTDHHKFVEFVRGTAKDCSDDVWRLTPLGREIIDTFPPSHSPRAWLEAKAEIDAGWPDKADR